MARLKELYNSEIAPKLKEELGLDNVMAVPRICLLYTSDAADES